MLFRKVAEPPDDDVRQMMLARDDPAQFAPIYERYFDRVYAYCLRRTGGTQEAEDLCSQVFARALQGLHTYRGGMVAAWLFQIAHNTVVTHYRKRRPLVPLDEYDALPDERLADALEQAEDGRILRELVAALSEEQRALLALMLDGGLNSHEAGAALGKNAVTIRVQMHRIVKHLRERYQELTGERVP